MAPYFAQVPLLGPGGLCRKDICTVLAPLGAHSASIWSYERLAEQQIIRLLSVRHRPAVTQATPRASPESFSGRARLECDFSPVFGLRTSLPRTLIKKLHQILLFDGVFGPFEAGSRVWGANSGPAESGCCWSPSNKAI